MGAGVTQSHSLEAEGNFWERLSHQLKSFHSGRRWSGPLWYETRLKNDIAPGWNCGPAINVCVTALSLRLFFYLILPRCVCEPSPRGLPYSHYPLWCNKPRVWNMCCITMFPRRISRNQVTRAEYETRCYMLVISEEKLGFHLFELFSVLSQYQLDSVGSQTDPALTYSDASLLKTIWRYPAHLLIDVLGKIHVVPCQVIRSGLAEVPDGSRKIKLQNTLIFYFCI